MTKDEDGAMNLLKGLLPFLQRSCQQMVDLKLPFKSSLLAFNKSLLAALEDYWAEHGEIMRKHILLNSDETFKVKDEFTDVPLEKITYGDYEFQDNSSVDDLTADLNEFMNGYATIDLPKKVAGSKRIFNPQLNEVQSVMEFLDASMDLSTEQLDLILEYFVDETS